MEHSRTNLPLVFLLFTLVLPMSLHPCLGEEQVTFGPGQSLSSTHEQRTAKFAQSLQAPTSKTPSSEKWSSYPIYQGEITSVAVDPVSPLTVYIGTRDAGVFKTTDGGDTWNPARTGLSFFPIRSLAVKPDTPSTILAGTDFDGVWRSTDSGATWSKSSSGLYEGLVIFDLVFDSNNTNTVFAGLAGGIGLGVGNIYRSTNGGLTWALSDTGIPHNSSNYTNGISALAIDPSDSLKVYAGTIYEGAFASADGGTTWAAINEGLPGDESYMDTVDALATNPHDGNRLCAVIQGFDDAGFYCRSDLGVWAKISLQYELFGGGNLHFHPDDSSTVFTAGGVISGMCEVSHDGGVTWSTSLGHPESGTISDIGFHPSTPAVIYAAGDLAMSSQIGGVYRSFDTGATWSLSTQGVTAAKIRSVAIDRSDSNYLFAGTGGGAVLYSRDGGISWATSYSKIYPSSFSIGGEITAIAVDPLDPQQVYVASSCLWHSDDRGTSFSPHTTVDNAQSIDVTINNGTTTVYVGTNFGGGVFRGSVNSGWTQVNTGLPEFGGDICPILELTIDPQAPATVWAGTQYGGGIVRTVNGGQSWQVMGLTEHNTVDAIAVNPTNSLEILVGAGFWDGNLLKSYDGGVTWHEKLTEISFVTDIVYHPQDPSIVFAATEGMGVLRSDDGGETWADYSTGIFYPILYSLAFGGPSSPLLMTGSYGSGVYYRWEKLSLFFDDFESSDTSAWSGVFPGE